MSAGQQPGITLVQLVKDVPPNFAGETCGFLEAFADELVAKGKAKLVKRAVSGSPVTGAMAAPVKK